jgi:hypothetical protein
MCNQKNKGWIILGVKFTSLFNEKILAKSNAQPKRSHNLSPVQDGRKISTDYLHKLDATESIGDVRIGMWCHLAAETTSGLFKELQSIEKHENGEG